jgi:hypothetical protein
MPRPLSRLSAVLVVTLSRKLEREQMQVPVADASLRCDAIRKGVNFVNGATKDRNFQTVLLA